jgi:hypothetical protein
MMNPENFDDFVVVGDFLPTQLSQVLFFQVRLIGSILVPTSATEKEHYAYQIEVSTLLS